MNSHQQQFPVISDKVFFPVLTAGFVLPCEHLMRCHNLTFFAAKDSTAAASAILNRGMDWHLYGDTRWPSVSSWVEINTSPAGISGYSGVLVITFEIPEPEPDPFAWVAHNGPLNQLFPEERSDAAIKQRHEILRKQAGAIDGGSLPTDSKPRFVQSYCIYRGPGEVRFIACYMDLLNADGIPIPRYRTANVQPQDIEICRFSLHALFRLNEARLSGLEFRAVSQLEEFEPAYLLPEETNPPWTRFHPLRVLRTRPAIRAIPTPNDMIDGVMQMETAKKIMEARRIEMNLHMLAFDPSARIQPAISKDTDTCMAAFSHRANGGAIYILPERLVEEFDNTDCDEIRMKDIILPFPNVFLKFNPPHPLLLAENAIIDGCYLVKQGEEYLLFLTTILKGVNYTTSLSITCLDPTFSIHLPIQKSTANQSVENVGLCVNEAIDLGIREFLEMNSQPTENISQSITRPDGTTAYLEDMRTQSRKHRIEVFRSQEPVFRACLNIIVNAACFISFRPEDITEEWDENPPAWVCEALNDNRDTRSARDRKQHALRTISNGDYTRIKICGKNLFTDIPQNPAAIGHGVSPQAHWRRGHWRQQRHGTGLSLVTPRWIRPTIVKKENGPLVETRLYEVQEPQGPEPQS